jgi:enterochelin esterase family protein
VQPVAFTWQETDPDRPAYDVMVRLVGLDSWYDDRELARFLLKRDADGRFAGVIDLPDGLRSGYQFCSLRERRIQPSGMDDDSWADLLAKGAPDPSNPDTVGPIFGSGEPASILELPGALPQPWRTRRPAVAQGAMQSFQTGREWPTTVHVYTPPTAPPGPMPVAVLFDGQAWIPADIAATFDNLIADGVVPPFVAAAVAYPFGPVRVRGLTRPEVSLRYLCDDLMPWLSRDFGATEDPRRTVLIGQSLGGVAAVHAALTEPSRFGNVISQSGAFWWPGGSDGELAGAEVIAAAAAPSPVRFWLEAGAFETALIDGNRDLYAALREHGTDVSYREYPGGHDFACWRGGVADGLVALLGGLAPVEATG